LLADLSVGHQVLGLRARDWRPTNIHRKRHSWERSND